MSKKPCATLCFKKRSGCKVILHVHCVVLVQYYHKLQKQPLEVLFKKKVFLEILQHSQENTCAKVSFLIKMKAFSEHLQTTASKVSIKFKS